MKTVDEIKDEMAIVWKSQDRKIKVMILNQLNDHLFDLCKLLKKKIQKMMLSTDEKTAFTARSVENAYKSLFRESWFCELDNNDFEFDKQYVGYCKAIEVIKGLIMEL